MILLPATLLVLLARPTRARVIVSYFGLNLQSCLETSIPSLPDDLQVWIFFRNRQNARIYSTPIARQVSLEHTARFERSQLRLYRRVVGVVDEPCNDFTRVL